MMLPTPELRWTFLDVLGLPLDGYPAARVNRNSIDYFYVLEQRWEGAGPDHGREEWRPISIKDEPP